MRLQFQIPGRRQWTPIALDVQPDRISLIQLSRASAKRSWEVTTSLTLSRASIAADSTAAILLSHDELTAIDQALDRQMARGREFVLVAPSACTWIELLQLPPRTGEVALEPLARAEMARLARLEDSQAFQLAMWDVPPPPRRGNDESAGTSACATALPEAAIEPLITQLSARGWSVSGVVAPAQAAAQFGHSTPSAATAVIDVRWDRAAVTLVRDGIAVYHRDLPDNGLTLLARGLSNELGLPELQAAAAVEAGGIDISLSDSQTGHAVRLVESYADALATELDASFGFATRRYGSMEIHDVRVIGAAVCGLEDWLRSRFELASPDALVKADGTTATPPQLALCRGAALAATSFGAGSALLPRVQREFVIRTRTLQHWFAGAAAVLAIGFVGVGIACLATLAPMTAQTDRLTALRREQSRLDATIVSTNKELALGRAQAAFDARMRGQPDYGDVLRLVGACLDDATVLHDISLAPGGTAAATGVATPRSATRVLRRLKFAGTSPDAATLNAIVERLRKQDVFANVELVRTTRSSSGRGVSFDVTLEVVVPTTASTGVATKGKA